ncbi:unnamed protein product [Mucor hiemalis]
MSTLILSTRPNVSIQKILKGNRHHSIWLFKWIGYSSFAAAFFSMILYWYRKYQHQQNRQRHRITTTNDKKESRYEEEDALHINPKKKLQISTSGLRRTSSGNLSSASFSSYSDRRSSLITPPPSPLSQQSSTTMTRSISPRSWSSRLMDGVMSATRMKKKMTISLKNTVLWNPSRDVNTPNHAFHENTVLLLNKLAQVYDIYVMIQMSNEMERHQIQQLLNNANLVMDSRKILYCSTEQGKLHLIKHIQPSVHVEGGSELDDGQFIIDELKHSNIEQRIWITSNQSKDSSLQCVDNILKTSIAKQVGFE